MSLETSAGPGREKKSSRRLTQAAAEEGRRQGHADLPQRSLTPVNWGEPGSGREERASFGPLIRAQTLLLHQWKSSGERS